MVFDCGKVARNAVADSTNMKKRLFISLNFAQRYLTIITIKSGFAYHFSCCIRILLIVCEIKSSNFVSLFSL